MKFIVKIKQIMKRKNEGNPSDIDEIPEDETISSKYTMDELEKLDKNASKFMDAFVRETKQQRQEDRRRRAVEWAGGIFAFIGFAGWLFLCIGPFELIFNKWGLGHSFSNAIRLILAFGFPFLVALTFFWFSDKTGLHYMIKDWVVSWDTWDVQQIQNIHKYRTFPRRKRRTLIGDLKKELAKFSNIKKALEEMKEFEESPDLRKKLVEFPNLKKSLDALNAQFFPFGKEEHDTDDVEGSVERINRVISELVEEVDISSRRLISQPERASWKGFVLTFEETFNNLELELEEIAKYHKTVQPLVKAASEILTKVRSRIINS